LADGHDWDEDNAALDAVEAAHSAKPQWWTSIPAGQEQDDAGAAGPERPKVRHNTLLGSEQGPEGLVRKVNTLVNPHQGGKSKVVTTTNLDDALLDSFDLDEIDMQEDCMMFETVGSSST
jgi:hypothetical protein